MSAFTDRIYAQWRARSNPGGRLIQTGRPALPAPVQASKAKGQRVSDAGPSIHKPIDEGSNHGIRKF